MGLMLCCSAAVAIASFGFGPALSLAEGRQHWGVPVMALPAYPLRVRFGCFFMDLGDELEWLIGFSSV